MGLQDDLIDIIARADQDNAEGYEIDRTYIFRVQVTDQNLPYLRLPLFQQKLEPFRSNGQTFVYWFLGSVMYWPSHETTVKEQIEYRVFWPGRSKAVREA